MIRKGKEGQKKCYLQMEAYRTERGTIRDCEKDIELHGNTTDFLG